MKRRASRAIGGLAAIVAAAALYGVLAPTPSERLDAAMQERRWEDVEVEAVAQLPGATEEEAGELHRALGIAHGAQGEHNQALEAFRSAYALRPEEQELRRRMAIAIVGIGERREAQGDVDAAMARYREAVELAPEIRQSHRALVGALRARGSIDERLAALENAMEHIPQDVMLRVQLAWLLASHPDPARRDAERAMDLASDVLMHDRTPETLDTFAVVLAALGNYEQAIRFELDAIELAGGREGHGFEERRKRLAAFTKNEPYVERP